MYIEHRFTQEKKQVPATVACKIKNVKSLMLVDNFSETKAAVAEESQDDILLYIASLGFQHEALNTTEDCEGTPVKDTAGAARRRMHTKHTETTAQYSSAVRVFVARVTRGECV